MCFVGRGGLIGPRARARLERTHTHTPLSLSLSCSLALTLSLSSLCPCCRAAALSLHHHYGGLTAAAAECPCPFGVANRCAVSTLCGTPVQLQHEGTETALLHFVAAAAGNDLLYVWDLSSEAKILHHSEKR